MTMAASEPVRDSPDDAARYREAATALVETVQRVVPGWIERLCVDRIGAWRGQISDTERQRASAAGEAARDDVVGALRSLVDTDIDAQTTNPLAVLRRATRHAHAVLADAGVPPVVRDDFAERAFPDDDYGLVPATWADIDETLTEPGVTWSAGKAFLFKARRRREGRT